MVSRKLSDMRRIAPLLLALLSLCSCKLHDDYTGEPFIHLEYVVDGQRFEYEDWGFVSGNHFYAESSCRLWLEENPNGGSARFQLQSNYLTLSLDEQKSWFTDGNRYQLSDKDNAGQNYMKGQYGDATITGGWYMFTRKSSEPYCSYELHFQFTCDDGQSTFEATEGILQVGRRMQYIKKGELIKEGGN